MRKIILLVLALSLILIAPVHAADDDNLLINGGFDEGMTGWEMYMDDGSVSLSETEKYEGTASAKLNGIEDGDKAFWNKLRQSVAVDFDTDYVLSGYVKITGSPYDTWKTKISIEDSSYTEFIIQRMHDLGVKPNGSWQAFSMTFNSGANSQIFLSLCADNGGANNVHYYDSLKLTSKSGGGATSSETVLPDNITGNNLISDGGFEADGESDVWGVNKAKCAEIVTNEKSEGEKSLKITDCKWEENVNQFVSVKKNTNYILMFKSKVVQLDDEWSCLVKIAEDDFTTDSIVQVNPPKGNWKQQSLTFNSGSLDEICILILGNVSQFYVDDFMLYEIEGDVPEAEKSQMPEISLAEKLVGTASANIRIIFNNQLLDGVSPIIIDDRIMLPLRTVLEADGYDIGWNAIKNKMFAEKNGNVVIAFKGSNIFSIGGTDTSCDIAATEHNGSMYGSARMVMNILKCDISFMSAEKIVVITTK